MHINLLFRKIEWLNRQGDLVAPLPNSQPNLIQVGIKRQSEKFSLKVDYDCIRWL